MVDELGPDLDGLLAAFPSTQLAMVIDAGQQRAGTWMSTLMPTAPLTQVELDSLYGRSQELSEQIPKYWNDDLELAETLARQAIRLGKEALQSSATNERSLWSLGTYHHQLSQVLLRQRRLGVAALAVGEGHYLFVTLMRKAPYEARTLANYATSLEHAVSILSAGGSPYEMLRMMEEAQQAWISVYELQTSNPAVIQDVARISFHLGTHALQHSRFEITRKALRKADEFYSKRASHDAPGIDILRTHVGVLINLGHPRPAIFPAQERLER